MRLIRFHIENYRVLKNVPIHFSPLLPDQRFLPVQQSYALDFLAGVNGTGKSTVLHLLGRLFFHLQQDNYSEYFIAPIRLEYQLQTSSDETVRVIISNISDEENLEGKLYYQINDEERRFEKPRETYLPKHIVIYTTGSEAEWLAALAKEPDGGAAVSNEPYSEEAEVHLYLGELPGQRRLAADDVDSAESLAKKPVRFIRSDRLPLVALCGLLGSRYYQHRESQQHESLEPVLESLNLDQLVSFSLRIRDRRGFISDSQQEIVERLSQAANMRIRQEGDLLLLFDMAQQPIQPPTEDIRSIFSIYDSEAADDAPLELFRQLNVLCEKRPFADAPLQAVNLFLRRVEHRAKEEEEQTSERPMLQQFDWLSDGERSFLARMALFALFRSDNLLILLDEPEVHFNDIWKRRIVEMLDTIMQGKKSHALITTHSSIALSDVPPENIMKLERTGMEVTALRPRFQTFGADPGDIMVHVFGAPQAAGQYSVEHIRDILVKARNGRVNRSELLDYLNGVAPGYWSYRIRRQLIRMQ
ncbi:MAG TPA: AAA family ATPase [Chloroflexota bacterium]|nr:AAA family ATPase [Chloroflexota bacterium]HUM67788.1 AAA family ATPase [Chloroflexota bacterium]